MGALDLGGESFEIAYDPIYHSYSPLEQARFDHNFFGGSKTNRPMRCVSKLLVFPSDMKRQNLEAISMDPVT